jgi:hypothetical protein
VPLPAIVPWLLSTERDLFLERENVSGFGRAGQYVQRKFHCFFTAGFPLAHRSQQPVSIGAALLDELALDAHALAKKKTFFLDARNLQVYPVVRFTTSSNRLLIG